MHGQAHPRSEALRAAVLGAALCRRLSGGSVGWLFCWLLLVALFSGVRGAGKHTTMGLAECGCARCLQVERSRGQAQ